MINQKTKNLPCKIILNEKIYKKTYKLFKIFLKFFSNICKYLIIFARSFLL
jgi:hypothetical protein